MKELTKKELIQFFKDDASGKYPLGFDEALLLISDYLDNYFIKKYIETFVDEVTEELLNVKKS